MKKTLLSVILTMSAFVVNVQAQNFVINDFEGDEIGKTYDTFWKWSADDTSKATATVVADPANASNKAVHYTTVEWNAGFKALINLPAGKKLSDFIAFSFDIYIVPNENESGEGPLWKCMDIYLDGAQVMAGANAKQADFSSWTNKLYSLADFTLTADDLDKTSFTLAFGLNNNAADYYIDNIMLIGEKEVVEEGFYYIDDFEDKNVGDSYAIKAWSPTDGEAKVSLDPLDENNKVINMVTTNWDAVPTFNVILPSGKKLGDYESLSFDVYNTNTQEYAEYAKAKIYIDGNEVYCDPTDAPETAPIGKWTTREIPLSETSITDEHKAKSGFTLGTGVSIGTGNYYMDNIKLKETGTGIAHSIVKAIKVAVYNGKILIQDDDVAKVDVYDSKGMHCVSVSNESAVDISSLNKGFYIVKIQAGGEIYTNKIMK